jgi:tetratricopeptide (TPR) repeat protein
MSSSIEQADEVCANCGKAAVDDVKLKICTACKLVKYCSVDCQKNHRPQHKKACKKRAAEMRDDKLFTQPDESNLGECPICCLPLPLDTSKSTIMTCCSKRMCNGCECANKRREKEQGLEHKCLFCREPSPETDEEINKNLMERIKANDPLAIREMGLQRYQEGDFEGAVEYWTKAAGLGDMIAHFNLSLFYREGKGVEKDTKKAKFHLEEAAIGGHPDARYNLGCFENANGRFDRASKHWIIAAKLGFDEALDAVKKYFSVGLVSKEDYEAALRGHQAAVDATKSEQREEAYANDRNQS